MKGVLFTSVFFLSLTLNSQGVSSNWYFGSQAGITFTTSAPTAVSGANTTNLGCGSFSDASGNLLFYIDRGRIYNRSNQVMANGNMPCDIQGVQQGVLTLPKQGFPGQY